MALTPAKVNFTIWKGATFRKRLTLLEGDRNSDPRDLTNYAGEMIIRDAPGGTGLKTLSSATNTILFGDVAGTIDLLITATDTTAITWTVGWYDLTITAPSGGDTDALLYGGISVKGI